MQDQQANLYSYCNSQFSIKGVFRMDFTGWVPPEIKIGCGIILALLGVIAYLLLR